MGKFIVTVLVLGLLAAGGWWWWRAAHRTTPTATGVTVATVERGAIQRSVAATGRVVSNLDVDIKCKASGTIIKLPRDISQTVKQDELLLELDPIDEQRAVAQAEAALTSSQARLAQAERNLAIAEANLVTGRGRAAAALAAAEARARDARAKAARMAQLLEKKLASQEDAESADTSALQAEADRDTARVAVEELKAQELALELRRQDIRLAESETVSDQLALDNARQRLKDCTVLAPMNGVVAAQGVQIGTIISSGITNVGGGTTVLTISDLSRVFVLAAVDESDIGAVTLGQTVRITADAYPKREFKGEVKRIATRGVNVSNVVTFEVKIEVVDERKDLLKPEMTANVEVVIERKEDVLAVPVEALTRIKAKTPDGAAGDATRRDRRRPGQAEGADGATGRHGPPPAAGADAATGSGNHQPPAATGVGAATERAARWSVQVVNADGTVTEREVRTGLSDGTRTEVVEGLTAGERVQVRKNEAPSQWRSRGPFGGPH